MTPDQINRRFAELIGLCVHKPGWAWMIGEDRRARNQCKKCNQEYFEGEECSDFISDPRLVLVEMMKREDWHWFNGFLLRDTAHTIENDLIQTRYILDTTGLLALAAIEWLEKEEGK